MRSEEYEDPYIVIEASSAEELGEKVSHALSLTSRDYIETSKGREPHPDPKKVSQKYSLYGNMSVSVNAYNNRVYTQALIMNDYKTSEDNGDHECDECDERYSRGY